MAHPTFSISDDHNDDYAVRSATTQPVLPVSSPVNKQRLTAMEWLQRARQLAEQHHTRGALRFISVDPHSGELLYAALRHRHVGYHYIRLCVPERRLSCSCETARAGKPCCHIGAALYLIEAIIASLTPAACESQRRYERMWEEQEDQEMNGERA